MRSHLIPVRMATIWSLQIMKAGGACGVKRPILHTGGKADWHSHYGLAHPKYWIGKKKKKSFRIVTRCYGKTWVNFLANPTVWQFLKKLKTELPCDPAIPLQGIYPDKTVIWKDICPPMFTALFKTAKTWKQAKCLTDERIKKMRKHTQ